jgi:hypothetical protein
MSKTVRQHVEHVATQCFEALELSDYGRCDIRLAADGTPYVIDVNPNCDLADGAGYARAGLLVGLPYDLLIEQIAISALKRNTHALAQRHAQKSHLDSAESAERPRAADDAGDDGGGVFARRHELRTRAYR